jgi:hypothetical protein
MLSILSGWTSNDKGNALLGNRNGRCRGRQGSTGCCHRLTPLAEMIARYDLYCSDKGTLWLLHRNLARDLDMPLLGIGLLIFMTSCPLLNPSSLIRFMLTSSAKALPIPKKTVEKEFDCFKNTYVSDQDFSISKILEEDTVPFFAPLKLLEYKGNGHFEKRKTPAKEIPLHILLVCILMDNAEHLETNKQISIEHLLEGTNQVCKYMNLSYSTLLELLQQLENGHYLKLFNNFGNRYIEVSDINAYDLLMTHYRMIGGDAACPTVI